MSASGAGGKKKKKGKGKGKKRGDVPDDAYVVNATLTVVFPSPGAPHRVRWLPWTAGEAEEEDERVCEAGEAFEEAFEPFVVTKESVQTLRAVRVRVDVAADDDEVKEEEEKKEEEDKKKKKKKKKSQPKKTKKKKGRGEEEWGGLGAGLLIQTDDLLLGGTTVTARNDSGVVATLTIDSPLLPHELMTALRPVRATAMAVKGLPTAHAPVAVSFSLLGAPPTTSPALAPAPDARSVRWRHSQLVFLGDKPLEDVAEAVVKAPLEVQMLTDDGRVVAAAAFSLVDLFGGSRTVNMTAPVHPVHERAAPVDLSVLDAAVAGETQEKDDDGKDGEEEKDKKKKKTKKTRKDKKEDEDAPQEQPSPSPQEQQPQQANTAVSFRRNPYRDAHLNVRLELGQLLPGRLPDRAAFPIARAVFRFEYDDTDALLAVKTAMERANGRALGMGTAELLTVRLSQEQKDNPELDIVCGFQLADQNHRLIVLECRHAGDAVDDVEAAVQTVRDENSGGGFGRRVLWNREVGWLDRAYLPFNVALKHVKLRKPLEQVASSTRIYLRKDVPDECYNACTKLSALSSASRLRVAKTTNAFPSVAELLAFEKAFGAFVSDEDIDGVASAPPTARTNRQQTPSSPVKFSGSVAHVLGEDAAGDGGKDHGRTRARVAAKPAVDNRNPAYIAAKTAQKRAPRKDYLKEYQAKLKESNKGRVEARRREREMVEAMFPDEQYHIYSGQKLEFSEIQRKVMREQLLSQPNRYFSYSEEFQSLAADLIDEKDVQRQEREAVESKFITPKGFVYPAPRAPEDFRKHAQKPSASRCEELTTPWVENELMPKPVTRDDRPAEDTRPAFDTVPVHPGPLGWAENPDWEKSVHLVPPEVAEEEELKRRAEREKRLAEGSTQLRVMWNSKLAPADYLDRQEYRDPRERTLTRSRPDPEKMQGRGDFVRHVAMKKNKVYRGPAPAEITQDERTGPLYRKKK